MRKSGDSDDFKAKAERYRQRADELMATAEDFHDPANRKSVLLLAEEYRAMADRVERFDPSVAGTPAPRR